MILRSLFLLGSRQISWIGGCSLSSTLRWLVAGFFAQSSRQGSTRRMRILPTNLLRSHRLRSSLGQSYLVSELLSRSERGTAPKHARAT